MKVNGAMEQSLRDCETEKDASNYIKLLMALRLCEPSRPTFDLD